MKYEQQVPQGKVVVIQESFKAPTPMSVDDDVKNKRIQMMKYFANPTHRSSGAPEETMPQCYAIPIICLYTILY